MEKNSRCMCVCVYFYKSHSLTSFMEVLDLLPVFSVQDQGKILRTLLLCLHPQPLYRVPISLGLSFLA